MICTMVYRPIEKFRKKLGLNCFIAELSYVKDDAYASFCIFCIMDILVSKLAISHSHVTTAPFCSVGLH